MDASQIWIPLFITFLAGISTGIGSLISLFIKKFKDSYLHFFLGLSAGVMIYVSFAELLPEAVENLGFILGNAGFFIGIFFILFIDFKIPHEYIEEHVSKNVCKRERRLMKAGVFTAVGIAIHNFPEGIAVFMSSLSDLSLGIPLAVAIAIHNIPEGIAVAMPIYYATKDRKKAFKFSLLSGLAEPLGALIGILILLPFLTPQILFFFLAFVAGIMVFISFDELLPICFKEDSSHVPILGLITGMLIMASSLYLL
ncbi:zinc transporter ZupT [Candidatus Woesearchaeota archaeon CG_4_10_14_0_2_um_filter_33_10]|nr:MAG: zinc transporter ZupT [Candidatus Woesearchaeota archaeon CG1_02_33_12]PIN78867.1 MAG: zinc transporter ZupT [Candidatus Woesearchaeota archaeon CG10_big_fil_rev_8_21_14_0_10_33_12]PIU72101.1 MAG: zinc transporter ZupT [Candidatus Woesearchaeota archaeon CG06_land_8_20_14_3_00_33_13]PIZ53071.1 MAG: zinc transporter ZupT [Candidatus Woesearchaeota archaeon CG_4_10_14_0_2_um_filter_33_10]